MNSAQKAIQAVLKTLNDPEVRYADDDEKDLHYVIGLLAEYSDEDN